MRIRLETQRYLNKHYVIDSKLELWKLHIDLISLFNCDSETAKHEINYWLSDKTDNRELLEYEYPYDFLNTLYSECSKKTIDNYIVRYINKEGIIMFELDLNINYFYCNNNLVWAVLKNKYHFMFDSTSSMINNWLFETLKLSDFTPFFKMFNTK